MPETLLRDLIELPETVNQGDFVLRLSEGINDPVATLRDYVVTDQVRDRFDEALGMVRSALESRQSKGTYLDGSFGSGKSHFMAVLHLLLRGNAQARSIPELAPVVQKHNAWMDGRKFFLVPYHLIGQPSLEAALLGGYADYVRKVHPDAPTPAVYRSAALLENAHSLRQVMGDAAFFKAINEGRAGAAGTASGWGDLSAGWDAASYEAATSAPPKSEDHTRLVTDFGGFTAPRIQKRRRLCFHR